MQIHLTKRSTACFTTIAICLILYLGGSTMAGFPLGFGKLLARGLAQDYCQVIYPQASLGKTVFNPVSNAFSTLVYEGNETFTIDTNPNQDAVGDHARSEAFLQDTGARDMLSRLLRTYGAEETHRLIDCYVVWSHADPMTPLITLRIDYADYDSSPLPNEQQMKSILAPIALDCITAVEECVSLDRIRLSYYHPDFNPDETGMTWQMMELSLGDGLPRTKDLLDPAQVRIR